MRRLTDSFSKLNNFKQQLGLKREPNGVSGYLTERKLIRQIQEEVENGSPTSLNPSKIEVIIEHKIIDASKEECAEALAILEDRSLDDCLNYLYNLKS